MGGVTNMSIYNERKPRSTPFKIVTMEYFEDFESDDKKITPGWQRPGQRKIRVVTTTRKYNLGSSRGDPIISVIYEYL
jgi:hypothetical protein